MILAALVAAFLSVTPLMPHRAAPPRVVESPTQNETMDAQDSSLTYGPFGQVWRVPMQRREIALTFDDGPYPFYTPLLLHMLERSRVPATFFLVGRSAQEFPELVQRLIAGGNEIGNHTFNHYTLTTLNDYQIAYQIAAGGAFLHQFTHRPVTLFRPPHGRYNQRVVAIAQQLGYHTIFWSDSPDDVKNISPDLVVARVLYQARPGAIVLMHSGQYKTVEALPVIIERLREAGYTFVTVSQLMNDGYYDRPL
ncbi:MAG: polysaccharide deacetylase family protein [Candidatus Eremiobacteraeota bacterium]|nr:polysaccharide deacetylase family protein [Candidatus Eremiobacteraeota bacterium]